MFYGKRFTHDCFAIYIVWFVLGFLVDVPHLGWWWLLIGLYSGFLGVLLVAVPYYFLAIKLLGGAIFWILEDILKLESSPLGIISKILQTVFYIFAVVYQFLLVRLSLEVIHKLVG